MQGTKFFLGRMTIKIIRPSRQLTRVSKRSCFSTTGKLELYLHFLCINIANINTLLTCKYLINASSEINFTQ
jgi:hypothetical protein